MQTLRMRKKILINAQVSALLKATIENDLELLPYQLFCIFAGVRPKEVERLKWSDVNIEEKFIQVPEETSKTGVRRVVDMESLLVSWLDYYVGRGGGTDGAIVPTENLRK